MPFNCGCVSSIYHIFLTGNYPANYTALAHTHKNEHNLSKCLNSVMAQKSEKITAQVTF